MPEVVGTMLMTAEQSVGCDFGTRAGRGFLIASTLTFAKMEEMTETTPGRDFVCRLTAWSFVGLAGVAIVAFVHVATHGGKELSDGWPVFLVFGAAFGVNSLGIIAQGDIRLRGITTVRRSDSPFFFWSLVVPGIVLAIVAVGLGIWGVLK